MRQYDDHVALSHASAVIQHGGPTWGLDLSSVHLTHLTGGGRKGAGVVHHHGSCRAQDLTRIDDHWVTSPTRTVLDTASVASPEAAVVVASDFMHRGLTSMSEIVQMEGVAPAVAEQPGRERDAPRRRRTVRVRGRVPIGVPDAGRKACRCRSLSGRSTCPTVGCWLGSTSRGRRARLFCEFDGRIKYTGLRRPNETIEQAVLREKRREEAILELTGWRIIRLTWEDLAQPGRHGGPHPPAAGARGVTATPRRTPHQSHRCRETHAGVVKLLDTSMSFTAQAVKLSRLSRSGRSPAGRARTPRRGGRCRSPRPARPWPGRTAPARRSAA